MNTQVFPSESQTIEYKESWRDEYLKWIREKYVATTKVVTVNVGVNVGVELTKRQQDIYNYISNYLFNSSKNEPLTEPLTEPLNTTALSQHLNIALATIKRDLRVLTDKGLIRRVGGRKTGHWEVVKNEEMK